MDTPPNNFYTYDAAYSHELAQHHLTLADQPDSGYAGWVYHKFVGCLESLPIIGIIIALCEVFFANCCCPGEDASSRPITLRLPDPPPPASLVPRGVLPLSDLVPAQLQGAHPLQAFLPTALAKVICEYSTVATAEDIWTMDQYGINEITFKDSEVACTLLPILARHVHHIKFADLFITTVHIKTIDEIYRDPSNLPEMRMIFNSKGIQSITVYSRDYPILITHAKFDAQITSKELRSDFDEFSKCKLRHTTFQINSPMPLLEREVSYLSSAATLELDLSSMAGEDIALIPEFPNLVKVHTVRHRAELVFSNYPQLFRESLQTAVLASDVKSIDEDLLFIANRCPNLKTLELFNDSDTMTDQGLMNLAKLQIQSFFISGGKFTAEGFCTYFQNKASGSVTWGPEDLGSVKQDDRLAFLAPMLPKFQANNLNARLWRMGYIVIERLPPRSKDKA